MKDQLFLLNPGFADAAGDGPFYCGDSVPVEGLLSFFPSLREQVDVKYVDFKKPRAEVVSLIGAANQSIPVLVLNRAETEDATRFAVKKAEGQHFIDRESDIRAYLSHRYGIATAK